MTAPEVQGSANVRGTAISTRDWKATRSYSESGLDYDKENESFAMMLVFGTVALCAFIFLAISVTNVAAHAASPEAAMVNDVLKAMKR